MTWGTEDSPTVEPQCEVLFELFTGRLGTVQLGRLLDGHDTGRLVALRELARPASSELAAAANLARSLAHPKFVKALGIIRNGDRAFLASEYLSGATLYELGQAVASSGSRLALGVAVRVVLDALRATHEATQLLRGKAHLRAVRCMYPESIWIADFGETFLSEILVAQRLAEASSDDPSLAIHHSALAASADMVAAGTELARLTAVGSRFGPAPVPDLTSLPYGLSEIVLKAMGREGFTSYQSLAALIDDLASLDESLIASEAEVSEELRGFLGPTLEQRRRKLGLLERVSLASGGDEATKFFRVAQAWPSRTEASKEHAEQAEPPDDLTARHEFSTNASSDSEPDLELGHPSDDLGDFDDPDDFDDAPRPSASSFWGQTPLLTEPLDRQTRPHIDPLLFDPGGRSTSPQLTTEPVRSAPPSPPPTRPSTRKTPEPRATPVRSASSLQTILLVLVALIAGAVLHALWQRSHAFTGSHFWNR